MRIGELARKSGVSVETIRFYEREGVLPHPARQPNGYRDFADGAAEQLRLLVAWRDLGISVKNAARMLRYAQNKSRPCADVSRLVEHELSEVQSRVRELRRVEAELKRLKNACGPGRSVDHCGILRQLARQAPPRRTSEPRPKRV